MIGRMDRDQYLATLRRDSAALLAAISDAGPDAAVPDCPGWTADDLAWHVGEVWEFWGAIVGDRCTNPDEPVPSARPSTFGETFAFAERRARDLDEVLSATDPATPLWTWGTDKTAAFVVRRMAQETAVHRLDAERAAGRSYAIDPELASDGVDEFLFEFLVWADKAAPPLAGSVHLHCTDVAGEWLVRDDDSGGYVVTREHAKGDAAIRGTANDLLLVLWRRLALDAVEVIGDRPTAARLVARTDLSG
jgi:uncharacterized protein (TIGR03083 family)